ncbi:alpha-N-acetylneuraminide alpha-2,8-sialyltransferase-like [Asterias rubens]|uniref:alpha-N-acetylneuraminide alpha-2,8-sialyltransferase-like n=1 Tax=Asterias rubens TaxID=7604 RepID=UPI001455DAFF|nr:alpha-N-acetylneuraminide alpha-2,8-sialyltransferase-like [Asterias rubens]
MTAILNITREQHTTLKPLAKTRLFTTEGPSTRTVTKTFEEYVRHFVKEYTNPYPRGTKHEKVFEIVRGIANQTWRQSVINTNAFRRDILGATRFLDSRRLLYLTKKNTQVGVNLTFDMNGDPWNVSQNFWYNLSERTVFEKQKRFKRCSIVGSSGVLAGSKCGHTIDEADFIFRFNLAQVKGHEDDVGTKTNFTTLNPSFVIKHMNTLGKPEDVTTFETYLRQFNGSMVWLPAFTTRSYFKFNLRIADILTDSGIATPIFNHPGHFSAVKYLWRRANYEQNWPSTGLYVVSSAFGLCDEIHLFGFWYFQKTLEGASIPYHYHNDISFGHKHSRFKEFSNLVHLHKKGILKMNFGKCKS